MSSRTSQIDTFRLFLCAKLVHDGRLTYVRQLADFIKPEKIKFGFNKPVFRSLYFLEKKLTGYIHVIRIGADSLFLEGD